jgi:hypothetical protein
VKAVKMFLVLTLSLVLVLPIVADAKEAKKMLKS